MKQTVILSIRGKQSYLDQEPEIIELVTEGIMEYRDHGWDISYEESDLTGLKGTTTTFRVEPGTVTLTRSGRLHSRMVFQEGVTHDSLYQMEFGALMLSVKATQVFFDIMPEGGVIDLVYQIDIENSAGILTLTFENQHQLILSRQEPLKQLWLADRTGGFHFDYDSSQTAWYCAGTEQTLGQMLSDILLAHTQHNFDLSSL